jgi:hypothetical protein
MWYFIDIMSETPLSFDEHTDEAISLSQQPDTIQASDEAFLQSAAKISQSFEELQTPNKPNTALRRTAVAAAALATLAPVPALVDAATPPAFSPETTSFTVLPGQGLQDAAQEIKGIETIDIRDAVGYLESSPANSAVLEDGLQSGEQIVIPVSVEGFEDKE